MKSYNEMAYSVLSRSDAIINERNKKRKKTVWVTSGVMSCCIAVIIISAIFGKKLFSPNIPFDYTDAPGTTDTLSSNYGNINYLTIKDKAFSGISGQSFKYIYGTAAPSSSAEAAPPRFQFSHGYIHVVAKAVEEYPDIYETLNEYGNTRTYKYRLFRMEVIDPLQSKLSGEFFYLLPNNLKGDLTKYDSLLISMSQLPQNFVLKSNDKLTAFNYIFTDPYGNPELGNIIAFTDGVFDESLWQDSSWIYGYQFADHMLDRKDDSLLVHRGATLKKALARRKEQIEEWGEWAKYAEVKHYESENEAVKAALEYIKPFKNGTFIPPKNHSSAGCTYYYRYINGCPTNEWVCIDYQNDEVTTSNHKFDDGDFDRLPDISQYIGSLDLLKFKPEHTDESGKTLVYKSAVGWYEKTQNGVYSVVRIAWKYFDSSNTYVEYYDETFILLDGEGDRIISREELIGLIGENRNISDTEYGVGIRVPMA